MCTLLLLRRVVAGIPIVLLMNRDEQYDRPALEPVLTRNRRSILAPRDEQAGGTWIGVNDMGLVVAISNRHEGESDSSRRSRGLLCVDALGHASVLEVKDFLEEELLEVEYNPFNLIYADRGRAFVTHYVEEPRTVELREDVHLLTNLDVDDAQQPRVRRAQEILKGLDLGGLERALEGLQRLASDHRVYDDQSICLHLETAGTVSSTIIAISGDFPQGSLFLYTPGRPCEAPSEDYSYLLEEMMG